MDLSLKDRHAIVCGSTQGIGRAAAVELAALGASVTLVARNAEQMARIAAGLNDVTFTLVPKNEWDVAAGWLLVEAAGGKVIDKNGQVRIFNQPDPLLPGLLAANPVILSHLMELCQVT